MDKLIKRRLLTEKYNLEKSIKYLSLEELEKERGMLITTCINGTSNHCGNAFYKFYKIDTELMDRHMKMEITNFRLKVRTLRNLNSNRWLKNKKTISNLF